MSRKTSLILKIAVPVLVVAAVAGIWIAKNGGAGQGPGQTVPASAPQTSAAAPDETGTAAPSDETGALKTPASSQPAENADFALEANRLDLEKWRSYGLPLVIDFGAAWCGPCQRMHQALEELNKELKGKVIIKYIDLSEYADAGGDFPVSVFPTQFFFDKNGNPFNPKDADALGLILYNLKTTGKHVYTAHEGLLTKEELGKIIGEMQK